MKRSLRNQIFDLRPMIRLKTFTITLLSMVLWINVTLAQTTYTQSECHCLNNATNSTNGQYRDTIIISSGIPGQTWRLLNPVGFYNPQSQAPPALPILYFNNTVIPEVPAGSGNYRLIGKRVSGQPWLVLLSNSATGQLKSLTSLRQCAYPTIAATSIQGDGEVCPNGAESYSIPANANLSNVSWSVTGGTILGTTANGVNVRWGTTPGTYQIKVTGVLRSYVGQATPCPFESVRAISITDLSKATQIVGDFGNCIGAVEEYKLASNSFFRNVAWSVTLDQAGASPSGIAVPFKIGDLNTRVITWPSTPGTYFLRVTGEYRPTSTSPNWCTFTTVKQVDIVNEGGGPLACVGEVNLSLNPSCELTFSPTQFLTAMPFPSSSYNIIIRDIQADTIIPNGTIGFKYLNKKLEVMVQHECSGNACWGYTTIEDKSIPTLECPATKDIECQDVNNIAVTGFPIMPFGTEIIPISGRPNNWIVKNYDKCSDLTLSFVETSAKFCEGLYSSVITRVWKIVDGTGNSSTCTQTINVLRADIDDIEFPGNWDTATGPNATLEACSGFPVIPNDPNDPNSPNEGHPDPSFTGVPLGTLCLNASVSFTDAEIPICGSYAYKIVRKWKVVDHCAVPVRVITKNQLITIMDTRAPAVVCKTVPDTISSKQHVCGGDYIVPAPTVTDTCGTTTWTVDFLLAGSTTDYVSESGNTKVVTAAGKVTITNLPAGLNEIRYTVTDECGNFSYCYSKVFVEDQVAPTPVCDRNSIIAISSNGIGTAGVETLDGGSHDNCSLDYLKMRKMGTSIASWASLPKNNTLEFNCSDVGKVIIIELGVWDKNGNFNSCMAEVRVQDNFGPTITTLSNRTVPCTTDVTSLTQFGTPTASDNCGATITEETPVRNLNGCGIGTITRRFTARDADGNTATSTQVITVTNANLFDISDIDWPDTYNSSAACFPNIEPDRLPRANGYPRFLRDTTCSQLVMAYEDVVFKFQDNVCIKVLRTWTVIDWCQTSILNPNAGVYKNTQLIMLTNVKKPDILTGCAQRDIVITQGLDCGANVKITATAKDDCTDSIDLVWNYTIDEGNNGSIEVANGVGSKLDRNFPAGTHKVTWTVTDGCRNSSTCNAIFTITDTKKPTPVCREELVTVLMPTTKSVNIWASDFLKEGVDNCSTSDKVVASFSGTNRAAISRTYTCDSLAGAPSKDFSIRVYAIDEAGNSDYCTVTLRVQANGNTCNPIQSLSLRGNIYNEVAEEVKDVTVTLLSDQVEFPKTAMTADDGIFSFEELPMNQSYDVAPIKNDNPLNGVTTLDLVMIQRHILGLNRLESPYKLIAADINNSEKISAADLVELRKLILGTITEFTANQSWRFIDEASIFSDANNPWPLTERIAMVDLDHDAVGLDFKAIKIGDVNQSAKANAKSDDKTSSRTGTSLSTDLHTALPGQIVETYIYAEDLKSLLGLQLGLSFDAKKVELMDVTSEGLNMDQDHIGYNFVKDGKLFISWSTNEKTDANGRLMKLRFKALQKISNEAIFRVDQSRMQPELYTIEGNEIQIHSVAIQANRTFDKEQFELFQNIPNPFNTITQIGFTLPSSDDVKLTIFDINGKLVYTTGGKYQKGYNTISLDINNLVSNGVMYYQLETGSHSATRKMIVIK